MSARVLLVFDHNGRAVGQQFRRAAYENGGGEADLHHGVRAERPHVGNHSIQRLFARFGKQLAILSAGSLPSHFYLGSALVDTKTNEIPVARQLLRQLDLAGRTVALDALHTQDQTAHELVLEHEAHCLLTVKHNQPTLRQNLEKEVPAPPLGFSPSARKLPAQVSLRANRQGWGIENGTHQRLDVSLNDDRCRVCNTNGLWILGMLRRLAITLHTYWRQWQPTPGSLWLTDFQAAMGEDNLATAFALVAHRHQTII